MALVATHLQVAATRTPPDRLDPDAVKLRTEVKAIQDSLPPVQALQAESARLGFQQLDEIWAASTRAALAEVLPKLQKLKEEEGKHVREYIESFKQAAR